VLTPGIDYTTNGFSVVLSAPAFAGQTLYAAASVAVSTVNNQTFSGGVTDFRNVLYQRNASYSGGSLGTVNTCLEVVTNVTSPAANTIEWAFLAVMNNQSNTGENTGSYGQGNRMTSTTGPTWGGVMEVRDLSGQNNPAVGLVGLEVDNRCNGTDTNFTRVGIDVVCTRYNTSGAAAVVGWGVRVQNNQDTTGANCLIQNGFAVWQADVGVAFDCATSTVVSAALRMPMGAPILFDVSGAGGSTINRLQGSAPGLDHQFNGVGTNRFLGTGGVAVLSGGALQQIIGPRINGWGTSSGGARGAVTGASTLPQVAAALSQLLTDLQTHGMLGT
jgi:hypothetical protein